MVPFNSCWSKQVDSQGTGTDRWEDAAPRLRACPTCASPCPLPSLQMARGRPLPPGSACVLRPPHSHPDWVLPAASHPEFFPFDTHPEAAPASSTGAANSPPAQLLPMLSTGRLCAKALRMLSVSSSLSPAPAVQRINRNTNSPLPREPNTCTHTHTNTHLRIHTGAHTEAHIHAYRHAYAHTCPHMHIHVCTCIYTSVCLYIHTPMQAHTYIHTYTRVLTFIYMHAHVHTHAHGPNILHQVDYTMSPGASEASPLKPHPPQTPVSSRS